jgi:hypothetical protein
MSSNVLKTSRFSLSRENGPTNFGYKFAAVMSRMSAVGPRCPELSQAVPLPRFQKD